MTEFFSGELKELTCRLLDGLGSPTALGVKQLMLEDRWEDLAQVKADPRSYSSPLAYYIDSQAINFAKKLKVNHPRLDRRKAAQDKWWSGERACYRSNERLSPYLPAHLHAAERVRGISEFFSDVQKLIASWIGTSPPSLAAGKFGPGATFSDNARRATVPDKMSSDPSLTRDALWFLPQWLGTQWGSSFAARHGEFSFVRGNRFSTAPKTMFEDRPTGSEPSINGFYQLSAGQTLRSRLLSSTGWDLRKAKAIHSREAKIASVSGAFCTLDLSNASDTICRNLVKILLPSRWFSYLDDLRSKCTLVGRHWVHLEKFSSMGNGFTFELETIIFAAICATALKRHGHHGQLGVDVFVNGDDMIVPTVMAHNVISVLRFCGFEINEAKSYFGSESFRESCGGDFFAGKPVRSYYLKNVPYSPETWIPVCNGLYTISETLRELGGDASAIDEVHKFALSNIPGRERSCRGPKALGDAVIWDDDVSKWRTKTIDCIRYVKALVGVPLTLVSYNNFSSDVILASATYGCGGSEDWGVIPRYPRRSYDVSWVAYS